MKHKSNCIECGGLFTQIIGRGKSRTYCTDECKKTAANKKVKTFIKCKVDGCNNDATRVRAGLCEVHYYRIRRNGSTELKPLKLTYNHSGGYIVDRLNGHALSLDAKTIYQHRRVYYDAHGVGPFNCHWCNKEINWSFLHIDHVDSNKKNNSITNLVASCPVCNTMRGKDKMKETIRRKVGIEFGGELLTMNEWAKRIGISGVSIGARIKAGWTLEDALTKPKGKTGPKTI